MFPAGLTEARAEAARLTSPAWALPALPGAARRLGAGGVLRGKGGPLLTKVPPNAIILVGEGRRTSDLRLMCGAGVGGLQQGPQGAGTFPRP